MAKLGINGSTLQWRVLGDLFTLTAGHNDRFDKASFALKNGRFAEARIIAKQLLAEEPHSPQVQLLTGIVAARTGQFDEAISLLEPLFANGSGSTSALFWLATAYRKSGNFNRAMQYAQRGTELHASDAKFLLLFGLCQMDMQQWDAAANTLQSAINLEPNMSPAYYNIGVVFEQLKRPKDAVSALSAALSLDPNHLETNQRLGQLLVFQGDPEGAQECAERILKLDPVSAFGHSLMAVSLVGRNRQKEAAEWAKRALEMNPKDPQVLTLYGTILQALGLIEESLPVLEQSIDVEPMQGYAYYGIVRARRLTQGDFDLIANMERVVNDVRLPLASKGELEYALGKAYADLGDFQRGMRHYNSANDLTQKARFGGNQFDRQSFLNSAIQKLESFNPLSLSSISGLGSPSTLPIIVCGMIRSGTTLMEQILSSHPSIGGAGEKRFWIDVADELVKNSAERASPGKLENLGRQYLKLLSEVAPGNPMVVDKMPGNYENLGLIHAVFPNAKLIHVRRNPVDTCLSIWMTPNSAPSPWTNDKSNIVVVYQQYLRMMEHWRRVLPHNCFLEIDYEDLVLNQEASTRRIIQFCQLPWDDRCLHPEQNDRTVATPSGWQVRQPVYRTAVERWRNYEPWLGEFRELLRVES